MAYEELIDEVDENKDIVEPEKSKSKVMLISIIVAVQIVAAILLIIFVILPQFVDDPVSGEEGSISDMVEEAEDEGEERELGEIYEISDLTVNPKGSMGRRFAVFELALEINSADDVPTLQKFHPLIKDGYINHLRTKTVLEYSNEQKIEEIKRELKDLANSVLGRKVVRNVFFTRYVLQ